MRLKRIREEVEIGGLGVSDYPPRDRSSSSSSSSDESTRSLTRRTEATSCRGKRSRLSLDKGYEKALRRAPGYESTHEMLKKCHRGLADLDELLDDCEESTRSASGG